MNTNTAITFLVVTLLSFGVIAEPPDSERIALFQDALLAKGSSPAEIGRLNVVLNFIYQYEEMKRLNEKIEGGKAANPGNLLPSDPGYYEASRQERLAGIYREWEAKPDLARQELNKALARFDTDIAAAATPTDIGERNRQYFEFLEKAAGAVGFANKGAGLAVGVGGRVGKKYVGMMLGPQNQINAQDRLLAYAELGPQIAKQIWTQGEGDLILRDKIINPNLRLMANVGVGDAKEKILKNHSEALRLRQLEIQAMRRDAKFAGMDKKLQRIEQLLNYSQELNGLKQQALQKGNWSAVDDRRREDLVRRLVELAGTPAYFITADPQIEKLQREAWSSSVSSLSSLFTLVGSPREAKAVKDMGEHIAGSMQSFEKAGELISTSKGFEGGLFAFNGFLGFFMGFASLLNTGPTFEQLVMEKLVEIQKQISTLRTEMHHRFDRIDGALEDIYTQMHREFRETHALQFETLRKLDLVLAQTSEIRARVDALSGLVEGYFDREEKKEQNKTARNCLKHQAYFKLPMDDAKFLACLEVFRDCALDAVTLPERIDTTTDAVRVKAALRAGVDREVGFLLNKAKAMGIVDADLPSHQVKPNQWAACTGSFLEIASLYPQLYAKLLNANRAQEKQQTLVEDLIQAGEIADRALRTIRITGRGKKRSANVEGFKKLFGTYVNSLFAFKMESEKLRTELQSLTSHFTQTNLGGVDLTLGNSQFAYKPPPTMPFCTDQTELDTLSNARRKDLPEGFVSVIDTPPGLEKEIPRAFVTAEKLGMGKIRICVLEFLPDAATPEHPYIIKGNYFKSFAVTVIAVWEANGKAPVTIFGLTNLAYIEKPEEAKNEIMSTEEAKVALEEGKFNRLDGINYLQRKYWQKYLMNNFFESKVTHHLKMIRLQDHRDINSFDFRLGKAYFAGAPSPLPPFWEKLSELQAKDEKAKKAYSSNGLSEKGFLPELNRAAHGFQADLAKRMKEAVDTGALRKSAEVLDSNRDLLEAMLRLGWQEKLARHAVVRGLFNGQSQLPNAAQVADNYLKAERFSLQPHLSINLVLFSETLRKLEELVPRHERDGALKMAEEQLNVFPPVSRGLSEKTVFLDRFANRPVPLNSEGNSMDGLREISEMLARWQKNFPSAGSAELSVVGRAKERVFQEMANIAEGESFAQFLSFGKPALKDADFLRLMNWTDADAAAWSGRMEKKGATVLDDFLIARVAALYQAMTQDLLVDQKSPPLFAPDETLRLLKEFNVSSRAPDFGVSETPNLK